MCTIYHFVNVRKLYICYDTCYQTLDNSYIFCRCYVFCYFSIMQTDNFKSSNKKKTMEVCNIYFVNTERICFHLQFQLSYINFVLIIIQHVQIWPSSITIHLKNIFLLVKQALILKNQNRSILWTCTCAFERLYRFRFRCTRWRHDSIRM